MFVIFYLQCLASSMCFLSCNECMTRSQKVAYPFSHISHIHSLPDPLLFLVSAITILYCNPALFVFALFSHTLRRRIQTHLNLSYIVASFTTTFSFI